MHGFTERLGFQTSAMELALLNKVSLEIFEVLNKEIPRRLLDPERAGVVESMALWQRVNKVCVLG